MRKTKTWQEIDAEWEGSPSGFPADWDAVAADFPGFTKHDGAKPPMGNLPWRALLAVREVMSYGASKYGEDNWRRASPAEVDRYIHAAFRHLIAHQMGHDTDPESGHSHIAHAATSLLFWLALQLEFVEGEANDGNP